MIGSRERLWLMILPFVLGWTPMREGAGQSWYGPGIRRIERFSRHEVRVEDHTFLLSPLAVRLDLEHRETTIWLYVGSARDRGKKRHFCPRGTLLHDGVSDRRLALSRILGLTVVKRKGECLEFLAQGSDAQARARSLFDAMGEMLWAGEERMPLAPDVIGLVFSGLPSPRASHLILQLPFGEEILISTRDLM